jgi:hypothetical protein
MRMEREQVSFFEISFDKIAFLAGENTCAISFV